jgi:hypothetical protein
VGAASAVFVLADYQIPQQIKAALSDEPESDEQQLR